MKSAYDKRELLAFSKEALIDIIEIEETLKLRIEELANVYANRLGQLRAAVIEMVNVTNMDFLDEDLLGEKMETMCACAESEVLIVPIKVNAPGGVC